MTEDLTEALLAAEARLQSAQLAGDVAELDLLLHDHLLAVAPDGQLITKAMDLRSHRERHLQLTSLRQEDLAYVVADRTGVTTMLASLTGTNGGVPFDVRMRYTRTWIHAGEWRILAAHIGVVS